MKRVILLILFGVAFGFVEAAIVTYLRSWFGINNFDNEPEAVVTLNMGIMALLARDTAIIPDAHITTIEILREAATIVMLGTVAALASRNIRTWLGAFLVAFAAWDLSYYIFLYFLVGWPQSLADIDVYFLIPGPWVGPVFTPVVLFLVLLPVGIWLLYADGHRESSHEGEIA